MDEFVKPYMKQTLIPRATELWDTKGSPLWDTKVLPGGKRLAQRLLSPKRSQPEVAPVGGDATEFAAESANGLATSHHKTDHNVEISAVHEGDDEDTPLAEVIQIDEYQNRRSA